MTTPAPSLPQPVRACVFALAGQCLAADIRHTREIVVLADRTAVPRAPAYVLGVANLRGNVVPVIDLGQVLGLPASAADASLRTIVLEHGGIQIAVPADEVLGLESFESALPRDESAPGPYGELTLGLLRRSDGMATLLDVPRLVDAIRVGGSGRSGGTTVRHPESTGYRAA
jgi:chemotaxis signal transduction protein